MTGELSVVTAVFAGAAGEWPGGFDDLARLRNPMAIFTEPALAARVQAIRRGHGLERATRVMVCEDLFAAAGPLAGPLRSLGFAMRGPPLNAAPPDGRNPRRMLTNALKPRLVAMAIDQGLIADPQVAWIDADRGRDGRRFDPEMPWRFDAGGRINLFLLREPDDRPVFDIVRCGDAYVDDGLVIGPAECWRAFGDLVDQAMAEMLDCGLVDDGRAALLMACRRAPAQFRMQPAAAALPTEAAAPTSPLGRLDLAGELRQARATDPSHTTELCRIMASFGSDKGAGWHNYTLVYDRLFAAFRDEALALFELGIGTNKVAAPSSMGPAGRPGASLRGWQAYFPRARIWGADIDADILFATERIRTFWTDQRDTLAIRALWREVGDVTFDIMIDDGLHEAAANIGFFRESFGRLRPGGIYVIEDIVPADAPAIAAFAESLAPLCRTIVLEALDHPHNRFDNRLLIVQK